MPFDLDISRVTPLLDRLQDVFSLSTNNDILLRAGERAGLKATEIVEDHLYPPASGKALPLWYTRQGKDGKTYQSKFKSLAQQRKVMALVKAGKIPYRRTGQLGRSIVSRSRLTGDGTLMIDVGSRMLYAVYVIKRDTQSHYFVGTWPTIQDDFEQGLPEITQAAVRSIVQDVNKLIKGD